MRSFGWYILEDWGSVCCWLGQRELVCFEYAVKELRFPPRKLGCDGFRGTTICRVMASFHNFMFFIYKFIFQFIVFLFLFCLAKKWTGGRGSCLPWPSPRSGLCPYLVLVPLEWITMPLLGWWSGLLWVCQRTLN